MDEELLTQEEHETVWLCGEVYKSLRRVIPEGPVGRSDLAEATMHIHALQQMVLAQAAARAYPDRYRLLGKRFEEE